MAYEEDEFPMDFCYQCGKSHPEGQHEKPAWRKFYDEAEAEEVAGHYAVAAKLYERADDLKAAEEDGD